MRRILYNAKVYVEKGVFRQAVLIEDDMIKAVGTDEEIKAMATDDTEMMDCGGKTLIPGLNDSHMHFMLLGETRNQAPIAGVSFMFYISPLNMRCINQKNQIHFFACL